MTIIEESFASLTSYWTESRYNLKWNPLFVLPGWLRVWWQNFSSGSELYLRSVWQGEEITGVAPLLIRGEMASLLGGPDVCDYLDFIVAPGKEKDFFVGLLDDLRQRGIGQLDLKPLRPDSAALTHLSVIAREREYEFVCREDGVSLELDLPSTWDGYLAALTIKQRHEVKRKLRRLEEAAEVAYRCHEVGREVGGLMDTFLKLFSLSQERKAKFMTDRMESFFRSLGEAMAEVGLLRFGILELDSQVVAMTLGFDYQDAIYLYNSAFDPRYHSLSVGLLSKVLCIKESIQRGKKKWDFLKGRETYKYHLGGREVPLYNCLVKIG